jgi:3-deoxy-manno-octulosonate cytidylyltransferase (CMP-KDO synthetase)
MGLYAYRREFLAVYASMPQTPLEKAEKLEQLRVLENGYAIQVAVTDYEARGIDTRADYEAFVSRQAARQPTGDSD